LQSTDTIAIDAQNMNFTAVKLNGTAVPFINTGKQIQFVYPFEREK
jgi:aminopeptidase N